MGYLLLALVLVRGARRGEDGFGFTPSEHIAVSPEQRSPCDVDVRHVVLIMTGERRVILSLLTLQKCSIILW